MIEVNRFDINDNNFQNLLDLYDSVDWAAYTNQPETLFKALSNSHRIWVATIDDQIAGLLRTISDGETIVYLQDILVRPQFQRQGVGSQLMFAFLTEYENVRQKILLTDNQESQKAFYEACGFQLVEGNLNAFYRFD
ncbi:MAG: hypothetical protein RL038_351 [Actinomycetota bacterium]